MMASEVSAGGYRGASVGRISDLIEGFKRFRTGILLQIIGSVFGTIGAIFALTIILMPIAIPVYVICGVISLIAFIFIFIATGWFKSYDPARLGIGRKGIILELLGLGIMIVGAIILLATIGLAVLFSVDAGEDIGSLLAGGALAGIILSIICYLICAVLALVGAIMYFIFLFRLAEVPRADPMIKTGVILTIVGIVVAIVFAIVGAVLTMPVIGTVGSVVGFIAWILIYIGAGNTLKALQPPYSPQPDAVQTSTSQYYQSEQPVETFDAAPEMKRVKCPGCGTIVTAQKNPSGPTPIRCPNCGKTGKIS